MTVPFGFSVGDFVDGIGLIRDIIEALQSTSTSSTRYQAVIFELFSLERALLEVKALRRGSSPLAARGFALCGDTMSDDD
jgi:hypothetical protein